MAHTSRPADWIEKAFLALAGLSILVLAFFFLAVALVAGALLALVIAVRGWWLTRKSRRTTSGEIIEGEYTVIKRTRLESHERRD